MSKLNDKNKQDIVTKQSVQKVAKPTRLTKKTTPKKDEVAKSFPDNAQKKPLATQSLPAKIQKKSMKTKKPVNKPMKHIADQIKALPSKRVWPD